MGWVIGIIVVFVIIGYFAKGKGNDSDNDNSSGGGGGRRMGLGTKMTIAGIGGYVAGKNIAKL